MRLLNVNTLELKEFYDNNIPRYAILSHRWGDDEVTYQVFSKRLKDKHKVVRESSKGYRKILDFCEQAPKLWKDESRVPEIRLRYGQDRSDESPGIEWVWIDTCCINKTSSAELSEAINSMYKWYRRAAFCCVYLVDVMTISSFTASKWFTRGWTLQELLAPFPVVFVNRDWYALGTKDSLCDLIFVASGIPKDFISGYREPYEATIAERFSWASRRETSRVEDEAYCLLGIFEVHMPLLYGEGNNAFRRLQEELLRVSIDDSIFAWSLSSPRPQQTKLSSALPWLADSVARFDGCGNVTISYPELHNARWRAANCQLTRWGTKVDVTIIGGGESADTNIKCLLVRLNCDYNSRAVLLGICFVDDVWHVFQRDQQAIQSAISPKLSMNIQVRTVIIKHLSIVAAVKSPTFLVIDTDPLNWAPIETDDKFHGNSVYSTKWKDPYETRRNRRKFMEAADTEFTELPTKKAKNILPGHDSTEAITTKIVMSRKEVR